MNIIKAGSLAESLPDYPQDLELLEISTQYSKLYPDLRCTDVYESDMVNVHNNTVRCFVMFCDFSF